MPVLYILGGANGVGKTTFYTTILRKKFLEASLPFLNVDLIVRNELGAYTEEHFSKAEDIYRQRISGLFEAGKTFMIESNLSKESDYSWLETVKKKGYEIILYFLATENKDININRVKQRVAEGGHDIPVPIIEHRFRMSAVYLKSKLKLFSEVYLIDNSTETPREIAVLKNGELSNKNSEDCKWANDILFLTERLREKKKE